MDEAAHVQRSFTKAVAYQCRRCECALCLPPSLRDLNTSLTFENPAAGTKVPTSQQGKLPLRWCESNILIAVTSVAEEVGENHSFVMSSESGCMQFVFFCFVFLYFCFVAFNNSILASKEEKRREEMYSRRGGKVFVPVPIVTVKWMIPWRSSITKQRWVR